MARSTTTLKTAREAADAATLHKLSDLFTAAARLLHDEHAAEVMPDFVSDLCAFMQATAYPMNVSITSTPETTRAAFAEVALRLME